MNRKTWDERRKFKMLNQLVLVGRIKEIKEDFYNLKYKEVIKDNMWREIIRKYQSTYYEDDDLEDDGIPYEEENDYNPELEIPDIHGEHISW